MAVVSKNINFLKNIKNSSTLHFSDLERFNHVLSFLELPFFFDNESTNFYRFEGSIYNFNYEITYRNYSIDLNLGLKVKTKLLMSMFMQFPSSTQIFDKKFSTKTSFLLNNGFSIFKGSKNNFKLSETGGDYFPLVSSENISGGLLNVSTELSDISIDLLSSYNKFHRILNSNMYEIDTFISTLNSNWLDFNNLSTDYHLNSLKSLSVVNDNLRTFSFLVSSLDGFRVLYPQFFSKYLYFKKVVLNLKLKRSFNLFSIFYNRKFYLFIYNNLLDILDKFLFKNLNLLYTYNYVVRIFLFFLINNGVNFFDKIFINTNYRFLYIYLFSNLFFEGLSKKFDISVNSIDSLSIKYSAIKYLKIFFVIFENKVAPSIWKPLNNSDKFFLPVNNSIVVNNFKNINFFLKYSHMAARVVKKCYHNYSIHYQPSEIFSAFSRFDYTKSSISHSTVFNNIKFFHYKDRAVVNYYSFLKFFSEFILLFFKRNFVNSILTNFHYNPKYLLFRYFSIIKLIFPLMFKRWLLNNSNLSDLDLSSYLNFLNYYLLTKKNNRWSKRKFLFNKKFYVKSKFPKSTKAFDLKSSKLLKKNVRFYSTSVNKSSDYVISYSAFYLFLKLIFFNILNSLSYSELSFFLVRQSVRVNHFLFNDLNFFSYSIYSFYFYLNNDVYNYFFSDFFFKNYFYITNLKILSVFELLSMTFDINLFYNNLSRPILRFKDFVLKVDYYTFAILRRLLDYFRVFKYNEYLTYNFGSNKLLYTHFAEDIPAMTFLPAFFNYKRSLFFNNYLIFKHHAVTSKFISFRSDIDVIFLNVPFFKFFSLMYSLKKLVKFFFSFFSLYLVSNVNYFFYKVLSTSVKSLQKFSFLRLSGIYKVLKNPDLRIDMLSFFSKKYMYLDLSNNFILLNKSFVNVFSSFNTKYNYFFSTLDVLVNDYLHEDIFHSLLDLEGFKVFDVLGFMRTMTLKSFFEFIDITYINDIFSFNLYTLKHRIDIFIWTIFNSAYIFNYNGSFYNDLLLFINKLFIDNYYKSVSGNFSKIVNYLNSSFKIFNFFLMFVFARDFILKFSERRLFFSYFYNLFFIYMFVSYLNFLQYRYLKIIITHINYYKNFNGFLYYNFNYLV